MMHRRKIARLVLLLIGAFGAIDNDAITNAQDSASASREINFSRDIRPILSNVCFTCHGPDELSREADLRLDTEDGLFQVRDGVAIVKRGDAAVSEIVKRIVSSDPDVQMPPPGAKKTLSDEQRQLLIAWVNAGATWNQHWAFVRPTKPAVPEVKMPQVAGWPRNEIDRFLGQAQLKSQLLPSSQADVYTLIRRVYLDLIGLPPSVEEADAWATRLLREAPKDETLNSGGIDDTAWQALVDDLLSRPEYGERWARRWLDLARYADTNGYEKDRERSIWPYRDWVINAINADMPFDHFTIEQLAGDMLPDATQSQRIATGFHRNTMLNEEGGIDPLEFRFHAMTDRVATTGTTWLGLTTGCAQCHTHKYDPITHRDYYQLMAFLNNADEPSLELPGEDFESRWQTNRQQADKLQRELLEKWPVSDAHDIPYQVVSATSHAWSASQPSEKDKARPIRTLPEQWFAPAKKENDTATYVVDLDVDDANFDKVKLSLRTGKGRPGPGNSDGGNFVLSDISFTAFPVATNSKDTPLDEKFGVVLPVKSAKSSVQQTGYELEKAFDSNVDSGWGIHGPDGVPRTVEATFELDMNAFNTAVAAAANRAAQPETSTWRLRITLIQKFGQQHTIGEFHVQPVRSSSQEEGIERREREIEDGFATWLQAERTNAVSWQIMKPVEAHASLPTLTIQPDHSIFASGDTAKRDDYYVTLAAIDAPITALRLEALPDERLPARGPGSTYYEGTLGDFYLTELHAKSEVSEFSFASATETYSKNRFGNNPAAAAMAIDGDVQSGWAVHDRQGERHVAVFVLKNPVPAGSSLQVQMTFGRHFASSLGRFRFSAASAEKTIAARDYSDDVERLLLLPDEQLSATDRDTLRNQFLMSARQLAGEVERIRKLRMRPSVPETLVMQERPVDHSRETYRHHRGEYLQPKEQVEPGPPQILHEWPAELPKNRLGFAKWLIRPENPLTARVVVNRQWAAFFGRGIVATVDDFGMQGSPPDHPELLDWLAVTFMTDDQWSVKQLHRRIVTSAAYRQSSAYRSDAAAVDPENRLLTFVPRLRLEAEIVRDSMLQASGTLSLKRGGVPVRPLQPKGVTEVAFGGPGWNANAGEDRYRRSIYTHIKRTAPFAMITTFDGLSGEACIANRNRSNTPLQALTSLNDLMFVDMAVAASKHILENATLTFDEARITQLFRQLLTRKPDQDELTSLTEFVMKQRAAFQQNPALVRQLMNSVETDQKLLDEEIVERAVWTAAARALFGVDEAVTRP